MLKLNYNLYIILQTKYSFIIKLIIIFCIYAILYEDKICLFMMEGTDPCEIKQPDIIETLQDQISHLYSENTQLRKEINANHLKIGNQTNEIIRLKQEIVDLKNEVTRLEIIIRDNYTSCTCNIL